MSGPALIRVLLVEDDEEDYLLTRKLLVNNERTAFDVTWVRSHEGALDALRAPSKLESSRARIDPNSEGYSELQATWSAAPNDPVPFLTTTSGHSSDLERYDGFAELSEPDSSDGQIFGFDAAGRVCQCGLRFGDVVLESTRQLWDDFADVVQGTADDFETRVNEGEAGDGA